MKFQLFKTKNGKHALRLVASNGRKIFRTQAYKKRQSAYRVLARLRQTATLFANVRCEYL